MKKERLPEPTIKRSRAAEILGGVCARTMRRYEITGALNPIKLNQRVTLYRRSEVEKILRGEISTPESSALPIPNIRAASGQFVRAE